MSLRRYLRVGVLILGLTVFAGCTQSSLKEESKQETSIVESATESVPEETSEQETEETSEQETEETSEQETEAPKTEELKELQIEEELVEIPQQDWSWAENLGRPVIQIREMSLSKDLEDAYFDYPEIVAGHYPALQEALEQLYETEKATHVAEMQGEFDVDTLHNYGSRSQLTRDMEITLCNDQFFSVKTTKYLYFGGAHGRYWYGGATYLVQTGERLTLDMLGDVKQDIYEYTVSYLRNKGIVGLWEDYEQIVADLLENDDRWHLNSYGVCIAFSEYETNSYAGGTSTVTIPYEKLPGLKEEFRPKTSDFYVKMLYDEIISVDRNGKKFEFRKDSDGIELRNPDGQWSYRTDVDFPDGDMRPGCMYYLNYGEERFVLTGTWGEIPKVVLYSWTGTDVTEVDRVEDGTIIGVMDEHLIQVKDSDGMSAYYKVTREGFEKVE